jgi:predicted DNA-binding transcriptional regulator AlpA
VDPPANNGNGAAPPSKKTVSIAELAYFLNCSRSTVYRYMKNGWLPPRIVKFGQKRFDFDEALEWMARDRDDHPKYNPGENFRK